MIPLLREQEAALTAAHQRGDARATRRLLDQFEPLVVSRVARRCRGQRADADVDDLRQEGRLGLLRAFDKFDPTNGASLLTYATWWVDAVVNKAFRSFPIVQLTGVEKQLVAASPRTIPHARLAARDAAVERMHAALSLDMPLGGAANPEAFVDRLVAAGPGPEERCLEREQGDARHALLRKALKCLQPKWLAVFTRRFLVEEPATLETIAQGMGLSRERVRQIEAAAFRRVAAAMGVEGAVRERPTGVRRKPRRVAVVALLLAGLFASRAARADCFTVRDLTTATAVATPTQPGGLRTIAPGARVCTAETAARLRDELAERKERGDVATADAELAGDLLLSARFACVAKLQAKDERIAAVEQPEASRWPERAQWGGAGTLLGLLLGLVLR